MRRKWGKWIVGVLLLPVSLVALLSILLYVPFVQDFAVRQAASYASEAMGMRISIGQIRLSFPLDLKIRDVQAIHQADTLLRLDRLSLRIQARPLFHRQVLIEAIDLRNAQLDTKDFLEGMAIKGAVGQFYLKADRVDLPEERATFNQINLADAAITLLLNDSTEQADTTSTDLPWRFDLQRIQLDRVSLALQMQPDSLRMATFLHQATLRNGVVDLGKESYAVGLLQIAESTLHYDEDRVEPTDGLDLSHIQLGEVGIQLEEVYYQGRSMRALLKECTFKEQSGLMVDQLTGELTSDSSAIHLPELLLRTPHSAAKLTASIPWNSLEEKAKEEMQVAWESHLGKEDLLLAMGKLPADFVRAYPNQPLSMELAAEGNLAAMRLTKGEMRLPGAFRMELSGGMEALMDSVKRTGALRLEAVTDSLNFLLTMLPAEQRPFYNLPKGMQLHGEAFVANQAYQAELHFQEDRGKMDLTAHYDPTKEAYQAAFRVDSLEPVHFMPLDSLYSLTASLQAEGQGTDPFARATWAKIEGAVEDIRYGLTAVSDVQLKGTLEQHALNVELNSSYPLAKFEVSLNGELKPKDVKAMLIADVEHLDLHGLHFMGNPFATSFQLFAEAESDLDDRNLLDVTLGNWEV